MLTLLHALPSCRLQQAAVGDLGIVTQVVLPQLHAAAASGNVEAGTALLDAGASAIAADEHGRTPLHIAAEKGHAAMVALLCSRAASGGAASADRDGNTALHVAASGEVAHELLRCAGTPDPLSSGDISSGLWEPAHFSLVLLLSTLGHSAAHQAAWDGRTAVLRVLLPHMPSPAAGTFGPVWSAWEGEGAERTPLLLAAMQGHVSSVQLLLRHAFCVASKHGDGLSCAAIKMPAGKRALARVLAAAEEGGSTGVVELLRKSGARPMAATDLAARGGASELEELEDTTQGAAAVDASPFEHLLRESSEYVDVGDRRRQYPHAG